MTVIIGVDRHKASHTAVAIGHDEGELGRTRVRATRKQVPQLLACQPNSDGRAYFDRKVTERKTKKEALRSLKRQISNAVYRQVLSDANGTTP
jgi:hypothetical protein